MATPDSHKSLRKKFVRTLKGKTSVKETYGEAMKVYLRVRPFSDSELIAGESQDCLKFEDDTSIVVKPPKDSATFKNQTRTGMHAVHRFDFSHVFGPETSQTNLFKDTTLDVVKDFVSGQNCLTFSYGVTNAGKTYTIYGSGRDIGILPRTLNVIFGSFKDKIYTRTNMKPKLFSDVINLTNAQESKEESKKRAVLTMAEHSSFSEDVKQITSWLNSPHLKYPGDEEFSIDFQPDLEIDEQDQFALWISFAEIYNEQIFDLLDPMNVKEKKRTVLKLGDDKNGHPYIKGLKHVLVCNPEEACKVLKIGQQNQRNASTRLNNNSSRSHCIFNLKLARLNVNRQGESNVVKVSQLSFVDLAGSERYTKTQNSGERLKEAANINTSLMTLGKCVEQLKYNQNHLSNPKNVSFRESKLTRLFQVFLCGKGKVSMIVNVSQCASAFDETLHALKFSAIARKVATINVESSYIEDLPKHDVQQLMSMIKTLQAKVAEEAMKKAMMELAIREEVAQEMAEQITEIENMYSNLLKAERHIKEEVLEKRIEILTNSVRKSQRRQRISAMEIFEDSDDEYVSSVFYHREQMKVKEQAQLIQCMKETIEKQNVIINGLREEVSTSAFVPCTRELKEEEDISEIVFNTPPSQRGSYTAETREELHAKSTKKGILQRLEGLKDSGSSISRSAKKLKKKMFHDSPSSPSSVSLDNGSFSKKDKNGEGLLKKTVNHSPKRTLRSRRL